MNGLEHIPRPALVIGLATLVPFFVLLILVWSGHPGLIEIFLSYAALVLALLGGAHWALATGPYGKRRIAIEWLIGLAALLAAWAALVTPPHLGLTLAIAGYFLLVLRDTLLAEAGGLPLWFAKLRGIISATAVITAILALIRLIS